MLLPESGTIMNIIRHSFVKGKAMVKKSARRSDKCYVPHSSARDPMQAFSDIGYAAVSVANRPDIVIYSML